MFSKLDQWCPWCIVTHGLNLIIAVCVFLMWPRKRVQSAGAETAESVQVKTSQPVSAHPSARTIVLAAIAALGVGFSELELLRFEMLRRTAVNLNSQVEQCVDYVEGLKSDGDVFVARWKATKPVNIARRNDDPSRYGDGLPVAPLDVVVFSDFECPSCARFAEFFEKDVVPLFGGYIRTTFKHYPIDKSCNSLVSRSLHPHACNAATMAEAARISEGNEAFWKVHDYLYGNRKLLASGKVGARQVAEATGIDEQALLAQMGSPKVQARIREDISAAGAVGVRGTPAVYANGKKIDKLAKGMIVFWDKLADDYFASVGMDRPASTRPGNNRLQHREKAAKATKVRPTPGNQGRKVAP